MRILIGNLQKHPIAVLGCLVLLLASLSATAAPKTIQTFTIDSQRIALEEVGTGLGTPWGMVFLNHNQLLITERQGTLKQLNIDSGELTPIAGAPKVFAEGQGGLLDVATDGPYQAGDWLYFTYVTRPDSNAKGTTTLGRGKLRQQQIHDWETLIVTQAQSDTSRHYGSRITFDDDYLYFGIGDRGVRENGQDTSNHATSILRLHKDGAVPSDNPAGKDQAELLPEVWSYGHRNPQGLVYDAERQILWEIEHGPRGGDELNRVRAGGNYGWPLVSQGKEYWGPFDVGADSKAGMVDPVKVYTPSIAPGSLLLYRGEAFPQWQGDLFAGALALRHLNHIQLNEAGEIIGEQRLLQDLDARIRALAQSPEGWIYLSTDSGRILRLIPASDR